MFFLKQGAGEEGRSGRSGSKDPQKSTLKQVCVTQGVPAGKALGLTIDNANGKATDQHCLKVSLNA